MVVNKENKHIGTHYSPLYYMGNIKIVENGFFPRKLARNARSVATASDNRPEYGTSLGVETEV